MPLQTAKSLANEIYQLIMIDVSLSGGIQAILYGIIGSLTPLQAIVLGLNGILILVRVVKIINNWKKPKGDG